VVADSGLGYLASLAAADSAGVRFVVPLRADTGWAQTFRADVRQPAALPAIEHCAKREQHLSEADRTIYKGLLAPFPVHDQPTGHHDLRVAYIWSSEEAASVAAARDRALSKTEDALARIRNGLGGRYYKTKKQVDARVAEILDTKTARLITVRSGPARGGKPSITWTRNRQAIAAATGLDWLYPIATNLPDPPVRPLTVRDVLDIYKNQWIVEQRHRDLKQTLHVRPGGRRSPPGGRHDTPQGTPQRAAAAAPAPEVVGNVWPQATVQHLSPDPQHLPARVQAGLGRPQAGRQSDLHRAEPGRGTISLTVFPAWGDQ